MFPWRLIPAVLVLAYATTAAAQSSSASYLQIYKSPADGPLTSDDVAALQACKDAFEAKTAPPSDGSQPTLEFRRAEVIAMNQCAEDSKVQGVTIIAAPSPIAPVLQ
jgi:hypothetical protein